MEAHRIFTTNCNTHRICWDQHPRFNIGDVVEFSLTNDDVVQAIAVEQDGDNMIFCMMDCLPGKYEMYRQAINCGDYENSDLRKKLNNELIDLFPVDLVTKLIPFKNDDFLRIPTEKEIFGDNQYGKYESALVEQWEGAKQGGRKLTESDLVYQPEDRADQQGESGMNEMKWIPIRERSPQPFVTVIVTISANWVTTSYMLPDKRWIDSEGEEYCIADTVTAWMPFPEAYKEESEDD